MPHRILIVEDEPTLVETIGYNLRREGYDVLSAGDGEAGLLAAQTQSPDLVILDIMLPKMNGLDVCRTLRRTSAVPVLMLTARSTEADKVAGLDLGADDYLTKPFGMRELMARVKAMLRRQPASATGRPHAYGVFALDDLRHEIRKGGQPLPLPPLEYSLLAYLLRNHGITFSRDTLLEKVWGYDYAGDTRTVDVHVRSLREKIEAEPSAPRHLITVRGVGYRLDLE
ncbi:MAG: response regulator transcription factor [Chloroflexi bacterium]|nr:response regulator transcription factor [Chloroflexota bacterium]